MTAEHRKRVIIVGAGFGGLYTARGLRGKEIDVLLVDRNNFHLFTPLLYQVATCGLDPSEIAYPVRGIFRKDANIRFLLGDVREIDYESQNITVNSQGQSFVEPYDYLVLATGTVTNYFNNPSIEQYGFGLKDLSDAVRLRNHILRLFERAAWTQDEEERAALTTMTIVGGGPTGLETAGALYELYSYVLKQEFAKGFQLNARVILLEAMDRLLLPYPERLQDAAHKQLESLGVEVKLNAMVETVGEGYVQLKGGERIATHTLVWAAGVKASPLAEMLDIELARGGRVPVTPALTAIGRENVFVAGDLSYLINPKDDQPYPQLIPVANQQGKLVAKNILHRINGEPLECFQYRDRGIMATIGRSRAVAWPFYRIQLTGWFAWVAWLGLHLIWLLGFRNQINVFVNWVWNYFTFDRSVRIILERPAATEENVRRSEPVGD
jgi:NADH:ubiquinone reductase (H+-translocating)